MTSSIDTNVFATYWDKRDSANLPVRNKLAELDVISELVASGPVYAELCGLPARTSSELDFFFSRMGIALEWDVNEEMWRLAGDAFRGYNARRSGNKQGVPKKMLADFVIGAHAVVRGHSLFTLDERHFRAAYPQLKLIRL